MTTPDFIIALFYAVDQEMLGGRCFRAVDSISEETSKLIAIDEETNHQIVHRCRFGKTNRAADKSLDPRPQIDVLAFDFLRIFLANRVLLSVQMALVGAPAIGVIACDAKRLQQGFQLQKDGILPSSKHIGQHLATVMINRVP